MIPRLTLALCFNALICFAVAAQQAKESANQTRAPIFDVGEIEVPDGDIADVLEFLNEMSELQKGIADDYRRTIAKIAAAQAKASNRILDAPNVPDEDFAAAARFGLATRVRGISRAAAEEQRKVYELVKRQLSIGVEKGLQRTEISNASMLASYLERYGDAVLAAEAYKTFAEMVRTAKNPTYRRYADQFEGAARRLALLGNPIELNGTLLDDSEFDWDSYRGKVVLVDFWATWCGPCLAEAPNVRKNYDLYHDRGFEVVGISLDTKKSALEAYVKKESVPWVNLYKDGAGWKHPMAVKYGVSAIPTVFLVDMDGKVVSLRARGAELGAQLEKLLGSKSNWERAIAELSKRITAETADTELLSRRAEGYLATEQWDLAKADWMRVTQLQPDFANNAFERFAEAERWSEAAEFGLKLVEAQPEEFLTWWKIMPVLATAAQVASSEEQTQYRDYCRRMVERFGDMAVANEADKIIKLCLLRAGTFELAELPVDTLTKALQNGTANDIQVPWFWGTRALLAYRNGDPKSAVEFANKSLELNPHVLLVPLSHTIVALAQHQLGNHAEANRALEEASRLIEGPKRDIKYKAHHDLLIAQIVLREADVKIRGKATP